MSRLRIQGLPCLLFIVQACASGQALQRLPEQTPLVVDICTLIQDPRVYQGRMVRVDADARAGAHYEILLSGSSCSETVVVLSIPKLLEENENFVRLREYIFTGFPGKATRAQATFVGRFNWYQSQVPARVLVLTEVAAVDTLHESE